MWDKATIYMMCMQTKIQSQIYVINLFFIVVGCKILNVHRNSTQLRTKWNWFAYLQWALVIQLWSLCVRLLFWEWNICRYLVKPFVCHHSPNERQMYMCMYISSEYDWIQIHINVICHECYLHTQKFVVDLTWIVIVSI